MQFMDSKGLTFYWAVLGDEALDMEATNARKTSGEVKSWLVQEQGRSKIPQYWLEVLEVTGGLHSNLVFPANRKIVAKMRKKWPNLFKRKKSIRWVYDWHRLAYGYLAKECTQDAYVKFTKRIKKTGTHYIDGGGDRVRLSRALKRDALAAKAITPWTTTNAKRSQRKNLHKPALPKATTLENWLPLPASTEPGLPTWYPIAWLNAKIPLTVDY